jgi:hypothetical protein
LPTSVLTPLPSPVPKLESTPALTPPSTPQPTPTIESIPAPVNTRQPPSWPSLAPTNQPVPAPTPAPSPMPTLQPTPLPTALPSLSPTPLPSAAPIPLPYAVADHLTRQFEYEFDLDTGAHFPVHAAADTVVAAVPPPRFSTPLSINVPTPQPTSSPTLFTLGFSLARNPVPTCGQRPRRSPRMRPRRCLRCTRLNWRRKN